MDRPVQLGVVDDGADDAAGEVEETDDPVDDGDPVDDCDPVDDGVVAVRLTKSRCSGISSLRSPVRPVGARASGFPVNSGASASPPVAWPTNCRLSN